MALMSLSNPGLVGAVGGLAVGLAQYVIATNVVRRVITREIEEGGDMPGMGALALRFRSMRRVLAGVSFLALPMLGFALGTTLGVEGGER
jgi:hypothetical protein